jgi:hypothetical protein
VRQHNPSTVHHVLTGREVQARGPLRLDPDKEWTFDDLRAIGIGGLHHLGNAAVASMDTAIVGPALTPSSAIPAEFLRTWMPGVLRQATQPATIDELVGIQTIGAWSDQEIYVNVSEPVAKAELYGDYSNVPLASYATQLDYRTVFRFEQGFQVGKLEEDRQARAGFNSGTEKRFSAELSLDLSRNAIGYNGFAISGSRTFGLLNDPNLPAYVSTAAAWSTATFDQIIADLTGMFNRIEVAGRGIIKEDMQIVLALPIGFKQYLAKTNTNGSLTVRQWLTENYPNVRIETTPNFNLANGGANVAYMWVESVPVTGNTATDQTIIQAVPSRFQVLGTEQRVKGYVEDFTNATAGVWVLKPWAVQRLTGL